MPAVGLLGRSERLLMQRYTILSRMRKKFAMPDAAFEDLAGYLNLIENPDVLDRLAVALEKVQDGAEALDIVSKVAHHCRMRREEPQPEEWGDLVRFDPRGRRNLYQSLIEEVAHLTATQRSLGALGRRLRQAELLLQKGCSMISPLDKAVLMREMTVTARQLLMGDVSLAVLVDAKGDPEAFWTPRGRQEGQRFPAAMRFLLKPLQTREMLLIQDLQHYPDAEAMPPTHINIQRVVSAPLMVRNQPSGVIIVGRTTYAPLFDAEDLKALGIFTRQMSIALENVHLHEVVSELAQLQERQRIAQDLHDSVVQLLFAVETEMEDLLSSLDPDNPWHHKMQRIRRLISRSTAELRGAIGALSQGPARNDEPLSVLLQELVEEFEKMTHIEATLLMPSQWPPLSEQAIQAIYRIVREALTNIQKHARATAVIVNVSVYLDRLVVTVQDNGVGFGENLDQYQFSDLHFGMRTMHQLADRAGGYLETFDNEDGGAVVRLTIPLSLAREGF